MFENDIPKYRKRKKKKTPPKSKHKHIYDIEVLFWREYKYYTFKRVHFRGTLCSICGKVGKANLFELNENGRVLDDKEVIEKHKHLPRVKYDGWKKKFYELPH